jgi:RNA 2',3'-cyclic 3'-phosphodiesterase
MRIFIALDIPGEIRAALSAYMDRARTLVPEARWARVEGLHVTLKFIGEVSDARVEEIKSALASVKAEPFTVRFAGAGFFPNAKSARVFWAGVEGGDPLPRLAASIDSALAKLGFTKEDKPYHPHLTLARAGNHPLRELQALITDPPPLPHHAQNPRASGAPPLPHHAQKPRASGAPPQFGTMTAREFLLYRSQPQKGGSRYTRLERFKLE